MLCRAREFVQVGGGDEGAVAREPCEPVLGIARVRNLGELTVRHDIDANPLLALYLDIDSLAQDGVVELV